MTGPVLSMNHRFHSFLQIIFCIFCAVSVFISLGVAVSSFSHKNGHAQSRAADIRFSHIARSIPKNGVYGYISSAGNFRVPDDPEFVTSYFTAQYALAPRVLARGGNTQKVIGWFPGIVDPLPLAREQAGDVQLIGKYGDGVYLFQKRNER